MILSTACPLKLKIPNIVICCYADESKYVRVAFQLQKNCDFGEQFLIVGDNPVLGSWEPSDALPMTWSDGHIWTVELVVESFQSMKMLSCGKLV